MGNRAVGAWGEEVVAERYAQDGFEVIARNWRVRDGEIDIVALRGDLLVVCEVKTRSRTDFGVPGFAVTAAKQRRIRRLAARFVNETALRGVRIRFDVAEVVGHPRSFSVNVIPSAF